MNGWFYFPFPRFKEQLHDAASSPHASRPLDARNRTPSTRDAYLDAVARFARHFGTPPDRLDFEHVRIYLLSLIERNLSWGYYNQIRCALQFFYNVTLQRPWPPLDLVCATVPSTLPEVLGRHEVSALFGVAHHLKHRALLATLYGAGVRAFEVRNLQIPDIDSQRMVLRIFGKGQKERLVPLSLELLTLLRQYWKACRHKPKTYLFPGTDLAKPLSEVSLVRLCHEHAQRAGLAKIVNPRLLRHTYATHLYENGVDIAKIQVLLGHSRLSTTMRYVRVALPALCATQAPFNLLGPIFAPAASTEGAKP
jgi:integrase/recombinase XerD